MINSRARGFQCARFNLDLSRPLVMGVVNVTPDSMSDGGLYLSYDNAVAHCLRLIQDGADIIDIGGESTRPNAESVSTMQELERVIPVVKAVSSQCEVPISVDTSNPEVMSAAIEAGASMINDVRAFTRAGALDAVAQTKVGLCAMHTLAEPRVMQNNPTYDDVVLEIKDYLARRIEVLVDAGVAQNRICIDPGFGFGKTVTHNCLLLQQLSQFCSLGFPVLSGTSRKSFIGKILNQNVPADRFIGSITTAVMAVLNGASIVRVHDVAATVDALKMITAVNTATNEEVVHV